MGNDADMAQTFRVVGIRHDGQRVQIIGGLDRSTAAQYHGELVEMGHEFKQLELEPDEP